MGPDVARVSAAITTPPSKMQPTIVVPVEVARREPKPWAWRAALRLWFEKSKPTMVMDVDGVRGWSEGVVCGQGLF